MSHYFPGNDGIKGENVDIYLNTSLKVYFIITRCKKIYKCSKNKKHRMAYPRGEVNGVCVIYQYLLNVQKGLGLTSWRDSILPFTFFYQVYTNSIIAVFAPSPRRCPNFKTRVYPPWRSS